MKTEEMNVHVDLTSEHLKPGNHAVMVLDNAGWHRAKVLEVPDNMTVDDVCEAMRSAWESMASDGGRAVSLTTRKWARVS